MYDTNNIFAKILRKEIPCSAVYDDEFALAFADINPQKKQHILVIPKGEYHSFDDFASNASADEIVGFFKAVQRIAEQLGIDQTGYRLISNHGQDGGQEVPHFHIHLLGGEPVGQMVSTRVKIT